MDDKCNENKTEKSLMDKLKKAEQLWLSAAEVFVVPAFDEIKKSAAQKDPKLRESYFDYKTKVYSVLDQADKEFDKIMKEIPVKDDLYAKIVFFKGLFVSVSMSRLLDLETLEVFTQERLPYLKTTFALLEPLKLHPAIIWLYMAVNKVFVNFHKKLDSESIVGKKLIVKTMFRTIQSYEDYNRATSTKPLNMFDICTMKIDPLFQKMIKNFFNGHPTAEADGIYNHTLIDFLKICIDIGDTNNIIERGTVAFKLILKDKENEEFKDFIGTVSFMKAIAMAYFTRGHFKQTIHLIAVIMCKVVEYRRLLPENSRNIINKQQAWISALYSLYGFSLLCMGLNLLDPVITLIPTCERVFESDEMAIYEKQFPTKIITDIKTLKSIYKKTKLWLERAEQLGKSAATLDEELINTIKEIKTGFLDINLKFLSLNA